MTLELLIEAEPFVIEGEILDGPQFAGLTRAEKKALAITSTFETGSAGGFYGLSGNFDGQGLSFGLVNWNIGSGSLQRLLRDFIAEAPDRWRAAFGPDADRFREVVQPEGAIAEAAQLKFVVAQLNEKVYNAKKKKEEWVIHEPWKTYFRRLSEDPVFQAIEVRHARDLLSRATYYCDYFSLKTERAFCMMFDAVSSHGKWWLFKKRNGVEWRRQLLRTKLDALAFVYGTAIPEQAKLRAIAEVIGETSSDDWRVKALARKLWFLTGKHDRAKELRGLEPTDAPFTTSTSTPPAPAPAAPRASGGFDPTIDMGLITAFVMGKRNLEDLTDTVFFQRHPERKNARITAGEEAAKMEWKAIRTRAAALFPNLTTSPQRELAPATEDTVALPIVTMLVASGTRDPSKLASEAFYALNPARQRRSIDRGETAAIAQWKRLRDGVVARVLATSGGGGSAARVLRTEDSAIGTTHYLDIDLHIAGATPMTGVFLPHGYRAGATVDAILYLHGHRGPLPIDRYFTYPIANKVRAPLREGVARSTKNVILVAPTLDMRSRVGDLVKPGGLDRYLDRVTAAIGTAKLRHLILAGHSGGGLGMNRIAQLSQRTVDDNLRACWGFDCFNNPKIDPTWIQWARAHPEKQLIALFATGAPTDGARVLTKLASREGLTNVIMRPAEKRGDHWDMLRTGLTPLIDAAEFLAPR